MTLNYTPDQTKAITTIDKNLQIIACAGSGKTGVVSSRIAHILKTRPEIKPENIVAFTYTEKAAEELKSRINKRIQEELGEINGLAELYVGTIHSFCYKILQDYIPDYQKFEVLDAVKTKIFIDRNYQTIGMKDLDMEVYTDTDHFISLMNIIRESELEPNRPLEEKYLNALRSYTSTFEKHCYFDFTMIMEKALQHLKTDEGLRNKIKDRIQFLTVDEYQDVNPIQEKLIRVLYELGMNLCVVGDDDQTIYQWRGSDLSNILTFNKRYENVEQIKLVDNFRSSEGVVDLASKIISRNTQRLPKKMVFQSGYTYESGDIVYREFEDPKDESDYMADRIIELRDSGLKYSDIVVLVRVHKLSPSIIESLREREIPFLVEGVNELFTTPEVRASNAIFQFLISEITESVLQEYWRAISFPPDEKSLDLAIFYLKELKNKLPELKFYDQLILQEVFQGFLDIADLKEEEGSTDPILELILYNLGKFSQVLNDYETIYFRSIPKNKLKNFCNFTKYVAGTYYPEGHLQNQYMQPDAVRIMTIHQSKGLEFLAVFIPGLSSNKFPHQAIGGKSVWHFIDKSYVVNQERYQMGNGEDERRLFYVAITRSKKFLFLSRANYGRNNKKTSQFLKDSLDSRFVFQYQPNYRYSNRSVLSEAKSTNEIVLNFSILDDYYHCPYLFKLSFFYGFCNPLGTRMGYGKSLHNMVMEIHQRYKDGEISKENLPEILERHFHLPYATEPARNDATEKANRSINEYYDKHSDEFQNIQYIEKDIEIDFGNGIRVNGRIDLVKKFEEGRERVGIIDFKTEVNEKRKEMTQEQLRIYALGYEKLTGEKANYLEIYNLGTNHSDLRVELFDAELNQTRDVILDAANKIRSNELPKSCSTEKCKKCRSKEICLRKDTREKLKVK
ncbi:MAG: ATP-dependent helicase [Leptospiraceae bacterium]|nr:ATP-dependent helicase [Leptospiraceae bacterium]MCP5511465.1 ATP-dependent helicase [Leptospiraceae bacterium]